MAKKQAFPTAVTPKGVAVWPRLNTPDTEYDSAGAYRVKLAFTDLDDPDLAAFVAKAEKLRDAKLAEITDELTASGKAGVAKKLVAVPILKAEEDKETGEETGRYLLNAKMKASGTSAKGPWTRKPKIYNASGAELKKPPIIGGGSTLKLSVAMNPYYIAKDKEVGCTFYLEAVQLITLVQGGNRDAASYGFGAEDGDAITDDEFTNDDTPFDSGDDGDDDDL